MLIFLLAIMGFSRALLFHRRKHKQEPGVIMIGPLTYYRELIKDLNTFDLWMKEVFLIIPVKGNKKIDAWINVLTFLIYILLILIFLNLFKVIILPKWL